MQVSDTPSCVLRIFNGPLKGAEFLLAQPATLFLVGPPGQFECASAPASIPADALYVPLEAGGENFEVLLGDNCREGCQVRVLAADGVQERSVAYQVAEQVGALTIALRPEHEPWAEHLLAEPPAAKPRRKQPAVTAWLAGAAVVVLVALGGLAYWLRDTSVASVEQVLAGAAGPLEVVRGRDGQVYVFAEHEREARWARQVLTRQGPAGTTVKVRREERDRLQALLADAYPGLAYHRLDLARLQAPQLWLSQQRNQLTPSREQALQTLLRQAMPYADDIKLVRGDDAALIKEAEQGLQRLAVPFERQAKADSVTFMLRGALGDTELIAIRDYVNEFYQRYGDRYVYFAVELSDDWLKDKSFQYGARGYVKLAPASWYFPKPQ